MNQTGVAEVLVPPVLASNTVEPLRLAALAGLGVALLPEWWVGDDIAAGRLRVLLKGWTASATGFDSNIYAVWLRGRQTIPKMRTFIDFLVETFEDRAPVSEDAAAEPGGTARAEAAARFARVALRGQSSWRSMVRTSSAQAARSRPMKFPISSGVVASGSAACAR